MLELSAFTFAIEVASPRLKLSKIRAEPSGNDAGFDSVTLPISISPVPEAETKAVAEPTLSTTLRLVPLSPPLLNSGPGQTSFRSAGFTL